MEATRSGKDFNEWCLLWLIKIDLIFSVDKILEYQLLAELDSFNFLFLFCEGGLLTLINGPDYTGEVSTGTWGNSTWVTFFLFPYGTFLLPPPNSKNNLHSISSYLMRARFQNSYHEQLMTIKCNRKDHPQLTLQIMFYSLSKFCMLLAIQQNKQCVSNSRIDSSFTYRTRYIILKNHCQELTLKETFILF